MICPNCGNNLNDESQFCDNCGTNLANNQNVQPEIQQNVEEQKIVSEQPVQQTPVENIQPMPQPEVQSTIESKTQNKPKKGNSALIIIIVIMLMCIVGLLLYIFVIKKDETKDNKGNNTTTTTTTTTTKKDDDNEPTTSTGKIDENRADTFDQYTDINKIKTMTKQYNSVNKYTSLDDTMFKSYDNISISIKINNNKELESTINGETVKLNINGEKAKYLTYGTSSQGFSPSKIYILTEEGNIYSYYPLTKEDQPKKIESQYKFKNFTIVSNVDDQYRNVMASYITSGLGLYSLIGITNENEYILLSYVGKDTEVNLGKTTKFLVEADHIYTVFYHDIVNGQVTAPKDADHYALCIYSDGSMNYIPGSMVKNKESKSIDLAKLFNEKNILDENNNPLKVKIKMIIDAENQSSDTDRNTGISESSRKTLIINDNNQIYTIEINKSGATTKRYNEKTIKNIEKEYSEMNASIITKLKIEYTDGTTEEIEGNGSTLFE